MNTDIYYNHFEYYVVGVWSNDIKFEICAFGELHDCLKFIAEKQPILKPYETYQIRYSPFSDYRN